ncbi:Uncharacterized protein SCF082_LOCUS3807 [Durusdinium trenchii]|uniref:Uncharacterized protein n=1 Tax=Durusdinium trenchii TaxID=1381693 RepID=A0ABP0HVA9_9DINO
MNEVPTPPEETLRLARTPAQRAATDKSPLSRRKSERKSGAGMVGPDDENAPPNMARQWSAATPTTTTTPGGDAGVLRERNNNKDGNDDDKQRRKSFLPKPPASTEIGNKQQESPRFATQSKIPRPTPTTATPMATTPDVSSQLRQITTPASNANNIKKRYETPGSVRPEHRLRPRRPSAMMANLEPSKHAHPAVVASNKSSRKHSTPQTALQASSLKTPAAPTGYAEQFRERKAKTEGAKARPAPTQPPRVKTDAPTLPIDVEKSYTTRLDRLVEWKLGKQTQGAAVDKNHATLQKKFGMSPKPKDSANPRYSRMGPSVKLRMPHVADQLDKSRFAKVIVHAIADRAVGAAQGRKLRLNQVVVAEMAPELVTNWLLDTMDEQVEQLLAPIRERMLAGNAKKHKRRSVDATVVQAHETLDSALAKARQMLEHEAEIEKISQSGSPGLDRDILVDETLLNTPQTRSTSTAGAAGITPQSARIAQLSVFDIDASPRRCIKYLSAKDTPPPPPLPPGPPPSMSAQAPRALHQRKGSHPRFPEWNEVIASINEDDKKQAERMFAQQKEQSAPSSRVFQLAFASLFVLLVVILVSVPLETNLERARRMSVFLASCTWTPEGFQLQDLLDPPHPEATNLIRSAAVTSSIPSEVEEQLFLDEDCLGQIQEIQQEQQQQLQQEQEQGEQPEATHQHHQSQGELDPRAHVKEDPEHVVELQEEEAQEEYETEISDHQDIQGFVETNDEEHPEEQQVEEFQDTDQQQQQQQQLADDEDVVLEEEEDAKGRLDLKDEIEETHSGQADQVDQSDMDTIPEEKEQVLDIESDAAKPPAEVVIDDVDESRPDEELSPLPHEQDDAEEAEEASSTEKEAVWNASITSVLFEQLQLHVIAGLAVTGWLLAGRGKPSIKVRDGFGFGASRPALRKPPLADAPWLMDHHRDSDDDDVMNFFDDYDQHDNSAAHDELLPEEHDSPDSAVSRKSVGSNGSGGLFRAVEFVPIHGTPMVQMRNVRRSRRNAEKRNNMPETPMQVPARFLQRSESFKQ